MLMFLCRIRMNIRILSNPSVSDESVNMNIIIWCHINRYTIDIHMIKTVIIFETLLLWGLMALYLDIFEIMTK